MLYIKIVKRLYIHVHVYISRVTVTRLNVCDEMTKNGVAVNGVQQYDTNWIQL